MANDLAALTYSVTSATSTPAWPPSPSSWAWRRWRRVRKGCYVTGTDGVRYLDCSWWAGVFTMGHRHQDRRGRAGAGRAHAPGSHFFLDPITAELAERIARSLRASCSTQLFGNSGAEAVEGALKMARGYTKRPHYVAAEGAFHGKTYGALSASGREAYKTPASGADGRLHACAG